ncbi:MAG: SufBD protein, partial [Candidatus Bipolaricaulia bacterium]
MKKAVELDYSEEFAAIARAYERSGGDPSALANSRIASLVVSGNRVLGLNSLPGLDISTEELADGIEAQIMVQPGTIIAQPVHLCFGLLPKEGVQR